LSSCLIPGDLDLDGFVELALGTRTPLLAPGTREAVEEGRAFLSERLEARESIYGVNTGFGPLVGRAVDDAFVESLQQNLLQQLSPNVGPPLPAAVSRGTLALRASAIARGHSGAGVGVLEALIAMVASGAVPLIRAYGSVGASGDLLPLARMARALRGEGELILPSSEVRENSPELLRSLGVEPLRLGPKDGLALVNGTSFSLAITALSLHAAERMLMSWIYPLSATLLLIFGDSLQHLSARLYELKAHRGALETAGALRGWLEIEEPEASHGVPQPPYSSRSLSLWLGVVADHLRRSRQVVETEINGVDDNPLLFARDGMVLHGANFQGVYTAQAADDLTAALAKVANLAERQLNRLFHEKLNGDLPPFLAPEPVGLHSGLQGFQLLATSLLADLRAKAVVHGAQSIPTNGDNQDVVSMSANAALNALEAVRKSAYLTAVLECSVARALQLRSVTLSPSLEAWWNQRSHLLKYEYAAAGLDELLEARKRRMLPWDDATPAGS
jgi:histidine ammonia-lyase